MKKSLIALAALSAFATAAQAQSTVSVYGVIDTGYNAIENTTSANVKTDTKAIQAGVGEASSNRLGFKGTEDLGGGVKAHFALESSIAQNTAMTFGGRAFWVGLQDAKMGELRVGRQDSTTRSNWLAHDQLAAANVAGNLSHSQAGVANGSSSTAANLASGALTDRSVSVTYISPRMSGVQFTFGVSQANVDASNANTTKTDTGTQAGLSYVAGKFSAGAAYAESTTATNAGSATLGTGVLDDDECVAAVAADAGTAACVRSIDGAAAANTKTKDTSLAASYDFGVAKVAYIYNKRDAKNSLAATDWATNVDRTSNAFSVSAPVGAKTVLRAGYGFGELRQGAASNFNADITGMQVGAYYSLSKRTTVYGIYGDETREITATTEAKTKEYSVGVRHTF
jgi:predicted porin